MAIEIDFCFLFGSWVLWTQNTFIYHNITSIDGFVIFRKSLESMNCHVSSKMSRTALNMSSFFSACWKYKWWAKCVCVNSFFSPSFQLMKWDGAVRRTEDMNGKKRYTSQMMQAAICLTIKTGECNTWAIFNMYVFDHMSCNKTHQRSLALRRNGITHEINN